MIIRFLSAVGLAGILCAGIAAAQPRSRETLDSTRHGAWDTLLIRDNLEQQTLNHIQSTGTGPDIIIICSQNVYELHFDVRRAYLYGDLLMRFRTDTATIQHEKLYPSGSADTQRLDINEQSQNATARFIGTLLVSREVLGEISDGRRVVRFAHSLDGLEAAIRSASECGVLRQHLEEQGRLRRVRPLPRPTFPP